MSCDEDHFICQECFSSYVESESNTEDNAQSVVLNGGRILCPHAKSSNCTSGILLPPWHACIFLVIWNARDGSKSSNCASGAYANKLIAMIVSDELYERYLQVSSSSYLMHVSSSSYDSLWPTLREVPSGILLLISPPHISCTYPPPHMIVSDQLYESFLQARDFVVGKDAVAGALAKVQNKIKK